MIRATVCVVLLLLAACASPAATQGDACRIDTDCVTPQDYLIRSVCAYSSHCIDGTCRVTCLMYDYSSGGSTPIACSDASTCNCSEYVPANAERCACISGSCGVIVNDS